MKVFLVFSEDGEYSDYVMSIHGIFSSKEKAEKYIEDRCVIPSDEFILKEYEEMLETWKVNHKKNLKRQINSLPLLRKELEETLRIKASFKDPNWGRGKVRTQEEEIERIQILEKNPPEFKPWSTADQYKDSYLRSLPQKDDHTISEWEVDNPDFEGMVL